MLNNLIGFRYMIYPPPPRYSGRLIYTQQAMMNAPIVSASQKAPQVKEALGAFIDTPESTGQFIFRTKDGILDELHDTKAAIISDW